MIEGLILMALGALLATAGVAPKKPAVSRRPHGPHGIVPPIATSFPVAPAEPTLERLALMADAALMEEAQRHRANGKSPH